MLDTASHRLTLWRNRHRFVFVRISFFTWTVGVAHSLKFVFDRILACSSLSNSLLICSRAAKGIFRFFLNIDCTRSFTLSLAFNLKHFPRPLEKKPITNFFCLSSNFCCWSKLAFSNWTIFFDILPYLIKIYNMATKGGKKSQKKKITAITVAMKIRVPGVGTQETRQMFLFLFIYYLLFIYSFIYLLLLFFFFCRKRNWTTYWFSFFLNTVVPFNLGHSYFLHTKKNFSSAINVLVRNKIKSNYFLVGTQQVHLHKSLQVSVFFGSSLGDFCNCRQTIF